MQQRARIPYRGQRPSSARQLPILAALHARSPTLFPFIIQYLVKIVNIYFYRRSKNGVIKIYLFIFMKIL